MRWRCIQGLSRNHALALLLAGYTISPHKELMAFFSCRKFAALRRLAAACGQVPNAAARIGFKLIRPLGKKRKTLEDGWREWWDQLKGGRDLKRLLSNEVERNSQRTTKVRPAGTAFVVCSVCGLI